jgi:FkbM family methyltransferase
MTALRDGLVFAMGQLGIYRPSRKLFDRVARRQQYAYQRRQQAFFSNLIPPGALVFDVGANHGQLTAIFLEVGARVVSVEPNPSLAHLIQRRYGREVDVEPVAVGERAGRSLLHIGTGDWLSTMSEEWIHRTNRESWTHSVSVPVVTIDDLVARHGIPQFIKLDIEGFELQALRGLSVSVDGLSLEYHSIASDIALACVERAVELGFRRFNETPGDTPHFVGPWLSAEEMSNRLSNVTSDSPGVWGDIYALR